MVCIISFILLFVKFIYQKTIIKIAYKEVLKVVFLSRAIAVNWVDKKTCNVEGAMWKVEPPAFGDPLPGGGEPAGENVPPRPGLDPWPEPGTRPGLLPFLPAGPITTRRGVARQRGGVGGGTTFSSF